MLFHVLRHVQPDHGALVPVHRGGQRPAKLSFPYAGRAQEEEAAHRPARVLQPDAAAADGLCHCRHRLVLAHNAAFQQRLQIFQPLCLVLIQAGDRDVGPQRHHLGDGTGVHNPDGALPGPRLHMHCRRSLIHQVYGLVRQKAVVDIADRQLIGCGQGFIQNFHIVVLFQRAPETAEHVHGLLPGRLRHLDRLKPALQRRVLFNMPAVFLRGSGANDLYLSPAQGRL